MTTLHSHGRRSLPVALSVSAALSLTHAVAGAGTLVATATSGSEVILVQNNLDVPISIVNPAPQGPLQFSSTSFNNCVTAMAGTIKSCANVSAQWLDLTSGNVASGFVMAGELTVSKEQIGDRATAQQSRTISFTVAGATAAEPYIVDIIGTRTTSLPINQASLVCLVTNANQVPIFIGDASGFSTQLELTNGTYTIQFTAKAELLAPQFGATGVMDFELAVRTPELVCGSPFAGSCFLAHQGPKCDDATCCETICTIDAFCCAVSWDGTCAEQATIACQATEQITDSVIDPFSGKRYAIYDSAIWLVARNTIQADGGSLAAVRDLLHQRWVHQSLLLPPPIVGVGSAWIGLTDAPHEGAPEGNFLWENGTPYTFANWAPGQPNAEAVDDDYVAMRSSDGRWFDNFAFDTRLAIAEFSTPGCGSGGSCTTVHGPGCSDGTCCETVCAVDDYCCNTTWDATCVAKANALCTAETLAGPFINHQTRSAYYILSPSAPAIAERKARQMGGTLAIPNSIAENTWLRLNLANGSLGAVTGWLGLHDQLVEGQFQTALGALPTFTGWEVNEPNNQANSDFVQLAPQGIPGFGGWKDARLIDVAHGFVEVPCLGDLSGDGGIGAADISILLGAWGGPDGDIDNDGTTGPSDLSILLGFWGPCATTSCCTAHGRGGCDLPVCQTCVCEIDPTCCTTSWDAGCVTVGATACRDQCQCDF